MKHLLVLLVGALLIFPGCNRETTFEVTGLVLNADNDNAVEGALVELLMQDLNGNSNIVGSTETDSVGLYRAFFTERKNCKSVVIGIRVSKDDYHDFTTGLSIPCSSEINLLNVSLDPVDD